MRSSTWLTIIGVAVLTFIILLFTGSITFKTEQVTSSGGDDAKVIRYVVNENNPVDLQGLEIVEDAQK